MERLVTALDGRRMLLVLDNCEHVVAAVAGLTHRLLSACPELRVLATSREALAITGEALRPLPPLELPPDGAGRGDPGVSGGAAVPGPGRGRPSRIRGGRGQRRGRPADLPGAGRPAAGDRAGGGALRSLPVTEVATRLDDRFRLLSRGNRAAAPRHQTLRAVVEWSWDLLDEAEQTSPGG